MTPRVLYTASAYRIVIVERPDGNGVMEEVPIIELAQGQDTMGQTRWYALERKDDRWGSRVLADIVNAMGNELAKRTEQ